MLFRITLSLIFAQLCLEAKPPLPYVSLQDNARKADLIIIAEATRIYVVDKITGQEVREKRNMFSSRYKIQADLKIIEVIAPANWRQPDQRANEGFSRERVRFGRGELVPEMHRQALIGKKAIYFLNQDYDESWSGDYWFPYYGYWNMTCDVAKLDEVRAAIKDSEVVKK